AAAHALAMCGTRVKDEALAQMARALEEKTSALLEANRAALERARAKGLTRAFLDRLTLREARIGEMAHGPRQIAALTDPAGAVMLEQDGYLDLVIPRGGEEFVRWVAERSRVPVLKHDKGVVHVFVDADADPDMATAIVLNAKTHRPSVCNALETLLVDRAIAERFLPAAAARLAEAGVELRGCPRTRALVPSARPATETDWDEEYLDLV